LWRAVAGFGVLGSLVAVLLALSPAYVDNYRFSRWVREYVSSPAAKTQTDNGIRVAVIQHGRALGLTIFDNEVQVSRPGGVPRIEFRYAVHVNMGLYRVDLHFHPSASGK
jgi:uncharacterized FAD-dependent dehydrogenase